ncbi:hypothetical protein ACIP88_00030 [Streptomyces uncialis]|uniref:hypothetical protein n=1 Tax=Streptomyces uncialis TaxID=1048205 RepID=UPI0037FBE2CC
MPRTARHRSEEYKKHRPDALDADLRILLCAADTDQLQPDAGTRVLTGDTGMRLGARQTNLRTLRLPEHYRKPGTAMSSGEAGGAP